MTTSLPPVSREQAFLETYFQCVGKFAYDKGKEACDREREQQRSAGATASVMWSTLVNLLSQLAIAEKTYSSLVFLGQKWFVKKDDLHSMHARLAREFRKIEEATLKPGEALSSTKPGESPSVRPGDSPSVRSSDGVSVKLGEGLSTVREHVASEADSMLEELLGHLCGQIFQFLMARMKTVDFYEQTAVMGTNRNMNFDDLIHVIQDIMTEHHKSFHHPILEPLKHSFSLECEVICHLLNGQLTMSHWQFLESLLHLNEAHVKLKEWAELLPHKEARKINFGASKTSQVPALYQWLSKYKALLVAKFGLYFHDVLSKQGEMKPLQAKAAVDFYSKIVSFQKRSDSSSVALILEAQGLEGWKRGAGYHHPDTPTVQPQGLDSYPAIFAYPPERPTRHWPGLISMMSDRTAELTTIDRHIYFYDEKLQITYFLCRIEPRITLAVIFECKKPEKDSYVNNFLVDIVTQLRGSKLFSALRPGK